MGISAYCALATVAPLPAPNDSHTPPLLPFPLPFNECLTNTPSEMTKKQRHKYERKQEKLRASLPKKIPLHEQSIDLTPADATAEQSLAARQELNKSQRDARRKGIRERNFLGSM